MYAKYMQEYFFAGTYRPMLTVACCSVKVSSYSKAPSLEYYINMNALQLKQLSRISYSCLSVKFSTGDEVSYANVPYMVNTMQTNVGQVWKW